MSPYKRMPIEEGRRSILVDLETAVLLAVVPVMLCVLLFAGELFGR